MDQIVNIINEVKTPEVQWSDFSIGEIHIREGQFYNIKISNNEFLDLNDLESGIQKLSSIDMKDYGGTRLGNISVDITISSKS